ncbi:MAG: tetratricopeptide repeat protein [Acidobacteriota bacterium]|nr:tetratricopeptide repeat protein [Acidobacteriota bacterium]MDH3783937.1 tetratricopeptide repeat protein [Acidobacteriota bacterium]
MTAIVMTLAMLPGGPLLAQEEPAQEAAVPEAADLSEGNRLVREAKYEEAEALLAELQNDFPTDVDLLLMRGELLLQLQRAEDARDVLSAAVELDAERERIQFQLGSALVRLNQTDEALERFGAELENTEDSAILRLSRLNRSMLFEQKKQWKDAAAELEALLVGDEVEKEIFADLVSLYLRDKALDQAVDALERGKSAGFESSLHYYSAGAHLFRADRLEEALQLFEQALSIDSDMARAERSLAAVLNKLKRTDEALVHLRRYLELDPTAKDAEKVREQIRVLTVETAGAP